MLAFVVAAALWHRRTTGAASRIDFSMLEAMLWTMAEPLLAAQLHTRPEPHGNDSDRYAPHGAYRCAGADDWLSLAVTGEAQWRSLCAMVPALAPLADLGLAERMARRPEIDDTIAAWARPLAAASAGAELTRAGIPAAALATSRDLVDSDHLRARGFWDAHGAGVLPGLPWRASFGRTTAPAPALGADTDAILRDILNLSPADIAALRRSGALG
jgi:crotonobetainyl-CoA:carnitine CoA-transferase CaiB-like acyl-CoA transferase